MRRSTCSVVARELMADRHTQSSPEDPALVALPAKQIFCCFTDKPCSCRLNIQAEALPPLPEIRSPELRKQVFTHRSVHARPTAIFEDSLDDPSPDNEMYVRPPRYHHASWSPLTLDVN